MPGRIFLPACCAIACSYGTMAKATTISDFYGTWRLDTLVGVQEVTGPGDGKSALGRTVVLSPAGSVSPAGTCDTFPPTYSVRPTREDLSDWGIPPNWLHLGKYHLPERAGFISTACPEAIVLDDNDLVVNLSGYFYLANRVR